MSAKKTQNTYRQLLELREFRLQDSKSNQLKLYVSATAFKNLSKGRSRAEVRMFCDAGLFSVCPHSPTKFPVRWKSSTSPGVLTCSLGSKKQPWSADSCCLLRLGEGTGAQHLPHPPSSAPGRSGLLPTLSQCPVLLRVAAFPSSTCRLVGVRASR